VSRIREEARQITGALHILFRNQSVPVEYAVAAGAGSDAPRHERERRIIEDLIARDNRYKTRSYEMANLIIEAKRLALNNESPEKILDFIVHSLEGSQRANEHLNSEIGLAAEGVT
jgi:hypothetical protein